EWRIKINQPEQPGGGAGLPTQCAQREVVHSPRIISCEKYDPIGQIHNDDGGKIDEKQNEHVWQRQQGRWAEEQNTATGKKARRFLRIVGLDPNRVIRGKLSHARPSHDLELVCTHSSLVFSSLRFTRGTGIPFCSAPTNNVCAT